VPDANLLQEIGVLTRSPGVGTQRGEHINDLIRSSPLQGAVKDSALGCVQFHYLPIHVFFVSMM
jgi:hypothetical protein